MSGTRSAVARVAGVLILAIGLGAVPAAGQSDTCATATPITPGNYSGSTVGATIDGASSCVSQNGPDVWYSLSVETTCMLSIATCGSGFDTVLSLHAADCPASAGASLVCNDDSCSLGSRIQYHATGGATYLIRVAGWNGATGSFSLSVSCNVQTERDSCSLATPTPPGSYTGTTADATNDGAASCGQSSGGPDHWFVCTPEESCLLIAETCGSGFDTVLSIHASCPGTGANQLACNDDSCANYGSRVSVAAQAGTPYYIRLAGFNGASGPYTLVVTCSPVIQADDCADAIEIGPGTHLADTTSATADGASSCAPGGTDVWFRYAPLEDCTLVLNTCTATFDTVLSVHTGCPGSAANQIACSNDDCNLQSQLAVAVQSGSTYFIRVAGSGGQSGACFVSLACSPGAPVGADVYVGELTQMVQFGRVGDTIGCAIDSPLCNFGTEPLDWIPNPDPRHPFMVFNLYRLMDGRFEQVGMSWAKHGWAAAQGNACGFGCTPYIDNTRLGVGCSDTYSAGANAQQSTLGPRDEINPWTGSYTYAGSHFATSQPPHTAISHRLQLRDADLDPALNPGAQYFCETYILGHDDANHLNSAAFEPVTISGAPGGTWSFDLSATASTNGPAILAWSGASRTIIQPDPADDGRCIAAVRATDNGDGTWHYEYALYNHDMEKALRSFAIPVGPAVTISNVSFSAVRSHDEIFTNAPWTPTRTALRIVWSTNPWSMHPHSNPLRWGTLYNFRFDADRPPALVLAEFGLYKPATPDSLVASITGPAGCAADFDGDGTVAVPDIFEFLTAWFGLDPRTDFDESGSVNVPDIFTFLTLWFAADC